MLRYTARLTSTPCQASKLRLLIPVMIIWIHSNAQSDCRSPFSLYTTRLNDSTVSAFWTSWTSPNVGYKYDAEFRESPSGNWTMADIPYGNSHEMCLLTNLKTGKCYDWRVRMICFTGTGITDTSEWAISNYNNGAPSCPTAPPNPPDPPNPPAPSTFVSPNFTFTIDPCSSTQVRFSNSTIVSGTTLMSLEWNLGDSNTSTATNPFHSYQKPGSYEVTLTVTDSSGKAYSKKMTINLQTTVTKFADAGPDLTICKNQSATLHATGGERYAWSPCIGLSNCEIPDPKIEPGTEQTYMLTVTNKDGCIDTDTVHVTYADPTKKIFIPNAFTPNNDGLNDQFRPLVSLQGQVDAEWKLFNRFGNMLFSSNSSTEGWDGKYKGEIQPPGNYTYMITVKATGGCPARNMKGTVLLIR